MGNRCHVIIVGSYGQGSPLKGSSPILLIFFSIFYSRPTIPSRGRILGRTLSRCAECRRIPSQATSNPKHIICSCNCGATRADWISYRPDMHECGDYVSRALHRRGGTRSSATYPHGERCIVDAGAWCCD
jgi:hypothetical protein